MKRKILLRVSTIAVVLAFLFSVFVPAIAQCSSPVDNSTSCMHEIEDVFCGSFSQQVFNIIVGQVFVVRFNMIPVKDVSGVMIYLITPRDLVRPLQGREVWVGNVEKGRTVTLDFPMVAEQEVDTYITVRVEESASDIPCSSSYQFRVTTPDPPSIYVNSGNGEQVRLQSASLGKITIKGKLNYTDENTHPSPVSAIKVYLMEENIWQDHKHKDEVVDEQWTDGNGGFSFTVDNWDHAGIGKKKSDSRRDPYIKVVAYGYVRVLSPLGSLYEWRLPLAGVDVPDGFYYDYGTVLLAGSADHTTALQILNSAREIAEWIYYRVGYIRPNVLVEYPADVSTACFKYGGPKMQLIKLPIGQTENTTVWHEYAHAFMFDVYADNMPSGDGPSPHNAICESSGGFALAEGFAEFMQCALENDPNNLWVDGHNIETNDWYNHVDSGDMDGNIVEGSAASILWDIFDPVDPADKDFLSCDFEEIYFILTTRPDSISFFFYQWTTWFPDVQLSRGPLCTICWHYGIDVDSLAPYGGSIYIDSGEVFTRSRVVILNLSCNDWGSGVFAMRFRNPDEGPSWSSWHIYSTSAGWTLTAGDGYKNVDVQYMDGAGWLSPIYSDQIFLDTVAPTGSISIWGSHGTAYTNSTSVELWLTYADSWPGWGVEYVRYKNEGAWTIWTDWEAPSTMKPWTLYSGGDGTQGVFYQVMDYAGWVSNIYHDDIILDTVAPTGSIIINGGASSTGSISAMLTTTFTDATSGVDKVRYRNEGEDWTAWESPSTTRAWTLIPGAGTKRVYYQIRDKVGWTSMEYYDEIELLTGGIDTQLFFNLSPNPATPFLPIKLEGILVDYIGVPISNAQVLVEYTLSDEPWSYVGTLTTDMYGEFSSLIALSSSTCFVRVSYAGDATHNSAQNRAYLVRLLIAPHVPTQNSIYFNFIPNPVQSGGSGELRGILMKYGDPFQNAPVWIEVSSDDGRTWTHLWTLTTNGYGIFSKTFTAPAPGRYLFRATWGSSSITTYLKIEA